MPLEVSKGGLLYLGRARFHALYQSDPKHFLEMETERGSTKLLHNNEYYNEQLNERSWKKKQVKAHWMCF